jgi:uncharacterized protein YciI
MGNQKGYVPSDDAKQKVSESLKRAYAEGRRQISDAHRQAISEANKRRVRGPVSEEQKRKTSETLKRGYAEGRLQLVGAALAQSQSPFAAHTDEERKARKLETQRIWREENPRINAEYHRKYHPLSYGWTAEQYEAEVQKREGRCDVCGRPQQNEIRLAIDHNHGCCSERAACEKCRRGLLCTNCNTLLGSAHDSVAILEAAIAYLKKYQKEKSNE